MGCVVLKQVGGPGQVTNPSDEPDWKYQPIIDRGRIAPPLIRFIVIGTFLTAFGYLLCQAIFLHPGLAIYMAVVFLFIGGIIFLAARDGTKPKNNEP